jgi:phenylacetate-coenzyme A ligase PaaK-like adenylate-forming protein
METINRILENQVENSIENVEPSGTLHNLSDEDLESGDHLMVATSGTTGESTKAPIKEDNLEHYREVNAEAFELAGVEDNDIGLNVGAPLPHLSGWAIEEGMDIAGSGTANDSYKDLFGSLNLDENLQVPPKRVTSLIALPRVALRAGENLRESTSQQASEIFPNLETGIFSGDVVNEPIRDSLKKAFGFENVIETYATSETGFIASAVDESSQMVPLIDNYIFEVVPDEEFQEKYGKEPVDIRDIEESIIGELALTDTYRDAFDFKRYLIGDKIKVTPGHLSQPGENIPTFEYMGRSDEILNFGGANVHENQIDRTVAGEWAVDSRDSEKTEGIVVELYVENPSNINEEKFRDKLSDSVPSIGEAYKLDVVEDFEIYSISEYEDDGEMKFSRMNI